MSEETQANESESIHEQCLTAMVSGVVLSRLHVPGDIMIQVLSVIPGSIHIRCCESAWKVRIERVPDLTPEERAELRRQAESILNPEPAPQQNEA